jgi:hypothetical protein
MNVVNLGVQAPLQVGPLVGELQSVSAPITPRIEGLDVVGESFGRLERLRGQLKTETPPPSRLPGDGYLDPGTSSRGNVRLGRMIAESSSWKPPALPWYQRLWNWVTRTTPATPDLVRTPQPRPTFLENVSKNPFSPTPPESEPSEMPFLVAEGVEGVLEAGIGFFTLLEGGEVDNPISMGLEGAASLIGIIPEAISTYQNFVGAKDSEKMVEHFKQLCAKLDELGVAKRETDRRLNDVLERINGRLSEIRLALPSASESEARKLEEEAQALQKSRAYVESVKDGYTEAVRAFREAVGANKIEELLGAQEGREQLREAKFAAVSLTGKFIALGGAGTSLAKDILEHSGKIAAGSAVFATMGTVATSLLVGASILTLPFNVFLMIKSAQEAGDHSRVQSLARQAIADYSKTIPGERMQRNYAKMVESVQMPKTQLATAGFFGLGVMGGLATIGWGVATLIGVAAIATVFGYVAAGVALAGLPIILGVCIYKAVQHSQRASTISDLRDVVAGRQTELFDRFRESSHHRLTNRMVAQETYHRLGTDTFLMQATANQTDERSRGEFVEKLENAFFEMQVPPDIAEAKMRRLRSSVEALGDPEVNRQIKDGKLPVDRLREDLEDLKEFFTHHAEKLGRIGSLKTGMQSGGRLDSENFARFKTRLRTGECMNLEAPAPTLDGLMKDFHLAPNLKKELFSPALTSTQTGFVLDHLIEEEVSGEEDPEQKKIQRAWKNNELQALGACLSVESQAQSYVEELERFEARYGSQGHDLPEKGPVTEQDKTRALEGLREDRRLGAFFRNVAGEVALDQEGNLKCRSLEQLEDELYGTVDHPGEFIHQVKEGAVYFREVQARGGQSLYEEELGTRGQLDPKSQEALDRATNALRKLDEAESEFLRKAQSPEQENALRVLHRIAKMRVHHQYQQDRLEIDREKLSVARGKIETEFRALGKEFGMSQHDLDVNLSIYLHQLVDTDEGTARERFVEARTLMQFGFEQQAGIQSRKGILIRDGNASKHLQDALFSHLTHPSVGDSVTMDVIAQKTGIPRDDLARLLAVGVSEERWNLVFDRLHGDGAVVDARLSGSDKLLKRDAVFASSVYLDQLQSNPREPDPVAKDQLRKYGLTDEEITACYNARSPELRGEAINFLKHKLNL